MRVDLVEFDAAITAGRLAEAVKLHRGPLLPEEPYDDHIATARLRTHLRYVGALQSLARHATTCGRHHEALSYALDWTGADPFDQSANDTLVAALLALDRQRDAAAARETYRTRMAQLGDPATPGY